MKGKAWPVFVDNSLKRIEAQSVSVYNSLKQANRMDAIAGRLLDNKVYVLRKLFQER